MSVPLSLLTYNPIEAYILILLCDIITGENTKIGIRNIGKLYLLGAVNLLFQSIPNLWYGENFYIFLSISEALTVHAIIIYIFYTKELHKNICIRQAFVAATIQTSFVIILSSSFGLLAKKRIIFFNESLVMEFISNLIISSIQLLLYTFIKKKGKVYEEYCKRDCRKGNS